MRRFYQILQRSVVAFLLWFGALTALLFCDCTRKQLQEDPYRSELFFVAQLPLYGIILFGCYALICIGWHLFTLRDCDDAYLELRGQIKQATDDLKKKGFNPPPAPAKF